MLCPLASFAVDDGGNTQWHAAENRRQNREQEVVFHDLWRRRETERIAWFEGKHRNMR